MNEKKVQRLRNKQLFQAVLKKGQSVRGSFLALYWLERPGETTSQVGYAVGKRLGNAVRRNKIRRRLRHIQHGYRHLLRQGVALVWLARPYSVQADFHELQMELKRLLYKAGLVGQTSKVESEANGSACADHHH